MKSFIYRAHEWLADHCKWVQYPNVREAQRRPLFKHLMPWSTRALLVLFAVVILPLCAIAMFFLGVLTWATVTA